MVQSTWFGQAVSIYGDYAIVGANNDIDKGPSTPGAAYFFKRQGTSWIQEQKIFGSGAQGGDRFGHAVSIYGIYAVVGAIYADENNERSSGAIYIFKLEGNKWIQKQKLTATNPQQDDYFGSSVSIYENYLIVGAYYKSGGTGSAYIFKNDGNTWVLKKKLTANDTGQMDYFDYAVSIYGEYAAVASRANSRPGGVYIFKKIGNEWTQQIKLTAFDGKTNDYFGDSVSLHDNYLIVGARNNDSSKGAAYIFKKKENSWIHKAK